MLKVTRPDVPLT